MPAAVSLRTDFSASELRLLAKRSKDNNQSRRLLSLAAVLDGMNRTDAPGLAAWIARPCATGCIASTIDLANGGAEYAVPDVGDSAKVLNGAAVSSLAVVSDGIRCSPGDASCAIMPPSLVSGTNHAQRARACTVCRA